MRGYFREEAQGAEPLLLPQFRVVDLGQMSSFCCVPRFGIVQCVAGRNTSFSLDDHFNAFIEGEVASGRYSSASDVLRAALRLLEDRETRLRAVRQALIDGENSGAATPFDFSEFVSRMRSAPRER